MFKTIDEVKEFINFMIEKKVLNVEIGTVKVTLSNGALYPKDYADLTSNSDNSTNTEGKPTPGSEPTEPDLEDEDTLFHSA